jgi:hypothetical protein
MRVAVIALFVAACAGPEPFGSPHASLTFVASPSLVTSTGSPRIDPTPYVTPAEPTPEPTIEPTPDDAASPRTEIEINQHVVDRPGVPAALRDNYWWSGSDVGLAGTTAQLGLPVGEWVQHAADGHVVSARMRRDGERATEILVRRFDTGTVVGEVRTSLANVRARLVGRRLFWTGMRPERLECGGHDVDGGVWVMDLDDDQGPIAIVEPGNFIGCGLGGRGFTVSPSGDTIAALVTNDPYVVDVIDVDSLSRRNRLTGFWPTAITDDTFIQDDSPPSDGQTGGETMTAYAIGNGGARWSFPDPDKVEHFGTSWIWALGSQFIVEYYWHRSRDDTDLVLASFDTKGGDQRELLRQDDTNEDDDLAEVNAQLSTASHLSLEFDFRWYRAEARSFSVLDVVSGEVKWDAYIIDPPWLCHSGGCFRDG